LRELTPTDADRDIGGERDRPLTRGDLQRLRRGEGDAQTVQLWIQSTLGLAAPEPPASGDLDANRSGWLLGVGDLRRRLYPRLDGWIGVSTGLSMMGSVWVDVLNLPHRWPVVLAAGMAPFLAFICGLNVLAGVNVKRQLARGLRPARLSDVPAGSLVTITGVIAEQPTVPSLFRGNPAVLFRNQLGLVDETRGIDFVLELPAGERARVNVRGAVLLDRPQRTPRPLACGPVSTYRLSRWGRTMLQSDLYSQLRFWPRMAAPRESSLGPGARVEVCGMVDHRLDPDVAATFDRHLPVGFVLRAGRDAPLYVRRTD
jgi:hypothetical protein